MTVQPIEAFTTAEVQRITSSSQPSGSGMARRVYDLGNHVLKVDSRPGGGYAGGCANEIQRWNDADGHQRQFLCPVVAGSAEDGWLIMVKAELLTDDDKDNYDSDEFEFEIGLKDLHDQNVGWLPDDTAAYGRRLVAIDYAYPDDDDDDDEF